MKQSEQYVKTDLWDDLENQDLSNKTKAVLLVLFVMSDKYNQSFPRYETIMKRAGIGDRRTLIASLKELVSCGIVERENRKKKNSLIQLSNQYTLIKKKPTR